MDPEAGSMTRESRLKFYKATLCLAYQSFGVVYGDLSTSPIYVFKSTFLGRLRLHEEDDEILGVLSLVFWTLTLIPLCKYIIFVLQADDNGEGGTFALYSLLCRRAKLGLLSASDAPDDDISAYNYGPSRKETVASSILKEFFDKYRSSQIVLLLLVLLGTSMVIGDGILTPSMSVLSAVNGVKVKAPNLHGNYTVFIACVILVGLFALQHFGTRSVGFLFAPILLAWLFCISTVGVYNTIYWNPHVVRALSPYYVYNFFKKAGKDGWSSLGGVVLCITGAEAMFADLGHFSQLSIRLAFTVVVYPCLVLAYMGEAAYLSKNKEDLQKSFYKSIPEAVFWPVFIIATLATMIGSQAIISATFSIISQCRALKFFPRVKVVHTSNHIHGQIYIPEANWILMVLCLAVVVGYRDTDMIGNAYGLAVIVVMLVTTCLMFLVVVMVWKRNILEALLFVIVFGSVELLYFSACLAKVQKGGWFPLMFSLIVLSTMCVWHYGTLKKQAYESNNKVSLDMLLSMGPNLGINRVPGIGLIYSNVATGPPPMFSHFVTNFPAIHHILIFVTVQSLTVPKVPANLRFVISRIGPLDLCLFQCVVRYGYKDKRKDSHDFENQLIETVAEFLQRGNNDSEAFRLEPVNQQQSIPLNDVTASSLESGVNTGTSKKTVRFRCWDVARNWKI
ncbi:putative potassium transporter 13 [Hibiscus syriacus]|uniref:Potassium transporter n=1 Tax=Hibiscus syriacus TaxID=106335 RepID=A0A6A2Y9Z6_HIBSY|nr:putative potassium transporter 13 [Hibiscus syriacus]